MGLQETQGEKQRNNPQRALENTAGHVGKQLLLTCMLEDCLICMWPKSLI